MCARKSDTKEFKKHSAEAAEKPSEKTEQPNEEAKEVKVELDIDEDTLSQKIEELESELENANGKCLRIQADFENYRKRTFKDISNARMNGQIDSLTPVLQVFDHFNMAMIAAEKADNIDAIKEGLKMILAEFNRALDEQGVEKVDALGAEFDPNLHEAMAKEHSDDVEEGKIIKQWSCGYKMGERLLRPAAVVVSSGPEKKEDE